MGFFIPFCALSEAKGMVIKMKKKVNHVNLFCKNNILREITGRIKKT